MLPLIPFSETVLQVILQSSSKPRSQQCLPKQLWPRIFQRDFFLWVCLISIISQNKRATIFALVYFEMISKHFHKIQKCEFNNRFNIGWKENIARLQMIFNTLIKVHLLLREIYKILPLRLIVYLFLYVLQLLYMSDTSVPSATHISKRIWQKVNRSYFQGWERLKLCTDLPSITSILWNCAEILRT